MIHFNHDLVVFKPNNNSLPDLTQKIRERTSKTPKMAHKKVKIMVIWKLGSAFVPPARRNITKLQLWHPKRRQWTKINHASFQCGYHYKALTLHLNAKRVAPPITKPLTAKIIAVRNEMLDTGSFAVSQKDATAAAASMRPVFVNDVMSWNKIDLSADA